MPNVLANLTPSPTYAGISSWQDITDYTATVTVTAGSTVLLLASVHMAMDDSDSTGDLRFYRGAALGGHQHAIYEDSSQGFGNSAMIYYAEDGVSGEVTYKVQMNETQANVNVDTGEVGQFLIIEFLAAEATLYETAGLTSSATSSGTSADITGHSVTLTPAGSDSILLCMSMVPPLAAADAGAVCEFSVGGTNVGFGATHMYCDSSTAEEVGCASSILALEGRGTSEITVSHEWITSGADISVDTAVTRRMQVIDIKGSVMHHDANGTGLDTATTGYTEQAGMTTTKTIAATSSVVLFNGTDGMGYEEGASDTLMRFRFAQGGTAEGGAQQSAFNDNNFELSSGGAMWGKTSISGELTFSRLWKRVGADIADSQTAPGYPRFQVIECKVAPAGGTPRGRVLYGPFGGPLTGIL